MAESSSSAKASDQGTPDMDPDVDMESPKQNGVVEDSGSDIHQSRKRKSPASSGGEEVNGGGPGDELFGSDSELGDPLAAPEEGADIPSPGKKRRLLDDEELDSGDDEGRRDRAIDDDDDETHTPQAAKEVMVGTCSLARHPVPSGSDGEVYLLKLPQYLGIDHKGFTRGSFEPPAASHHGKTRASAFSALQTANSTIRWRRDPNDPRQLQSNSRIIRWSDGSLTLQVGASPLEQHELPAVALAPPQHNPPKPTPVSKPSALRAPYDAKKDSHTYLVSAHPEHGIVQLTNHITASLSVQVGTNDEDDAAVLALQAAMTQAKGGATAAATGGEAADGPTLISINEDPELAKRKAEQAEKERARAERRRLNQAERERERAGKVLGRRPGLGGGLSMGALEEDELGMGVGRPRPKKPSGARKPRRRRDSYTDEDEEEDYGRRGRTREDEYDEDDGFLVGSDEEPEVAEDDGEDEEEILSEDDRKADTARKERQGADGEAGGTARAHRRRVVDDDEEDE